MSSINAKDYFVLSPRTLEIIMLQRILNDTTCEIEITGKLDKQTEKGIADYKKQLNYTDPEEAVTLKYGSDYDGVMGQHIEELCQRIKLLCHRDIYKAADNLLLNTAAVHAVLSLLVDLKYLMYVQQSGNLFYQGTFSQDFFLALCRKKYGPVEAIKMADKIKEIKRDTKTIDNSILKSICASLDFELAESSRVIGLFSVHTSQWKELGYPNVFEMVYTYQQNEDRQIKDLCEMIRKNRPAWEALKRKDWTTFCTCWPGLTSGDASRIANTYLSCF
jgi:hypothetical protein